MSRNPFHRLDEIGAKVDAAVEAMGGADELLGRMAPPQGKAAPAPSLPWACEAEQSVLGCLLLDNIVFDRIVGIVDAASFWHAGHRRIFAAIERLVCAGKPADVVTVYQQLRDAGEAADGVTLADLNALAQSVVSAANVRRYAEIVADKALRRTLLLVVDRTPQLIHEAESADEALDRVQSLVAGVKRLNPGRGPRVIGKFMRETVDRIHELHDTGGVVGIPTGLSALDEALGGGIQPGRVIVLAARPSVGKTSLATQILLRVGEQGHPALMLSQEMSASELTFRAMANMCNVPLGRLANGRLHQDDWGLLTLAAERGADLTVYVDDQPALTLLDIRAKARQVSRSAGGLDLLVVDYLQLCSSSVGGDARSRHHQIEQISRGMKTLAKELNVCVLLLSQLNRASEAGEPELQHLKESGSIEEDADVVVLLHPMGNEPDGSLLILAKVAKNRGGKRGRIALSFDGRTQRWAPSAGNVSRRSAGAC